MESGAKKFVKLTEKVYNRLSTEKERPKTPTLKESQNVAVAFINTMFRQFFEVSNGDMLSTYGQNSSMLDL